MIINASAIAILHKLNAASLHMPPKVAVAPKWRANALQPPKMAVRKKPAAAAATPAFPGARRLVKIRKAEAEKAIKKNKVAEGKRGRRRGESGRQSDLSLRRNAIGIRMDFV